MLNIAQLNLMYGSFLDARHTPVNYSLPDDGITLENHTVDAFELQAPIAGSIRMVRTDSPTDKDMGVVRVAMGFYSASKMEKDFSLGVYHLSLLKNMALSVAAKYFDLDSCEIVTFKLPGTNNYFRELENTAGIELRLFISKTKPPEGN